MDYSSLGVRVGLEVHQQLATHKLFCDCPSRLTDEVTQEFVRRLRPTQSELGEVDQAALAEARKNLRFRYQATPDSCLVEADEEPPHPLNPEALQTALMVALLLHSEPAPEVHVMRKIVIDGSNTTGFQRTALVSLGGHLEVDGKRIGITTICLEEDAARPVKRVEGEVTYRIDRLGIPLVEVSTEPDITSPEEARKVAQRLGAILRSTKRVMRGIGTIREDLNVSIREGARIEVKGVQELRLLGTYVEREVGRQAMLVEIAKELTRRGVSSVSADIKDLTEAFRHSKSKIIAGALRDGGRVLGIRLAGFAGLLKDRLGPELAARASASGVGGVIHSDELPGYGVTAEETDRVRGALGCERGDAFALVAYDERRGREALLRVVERAMEALRGVPAETRDPKPDGTTVYSRPLPGKARMYVETDVPPARIEPGYLEDLRSRLPEAPEKRLERLVALHGLHPQQMRQIVDEGHEELFEALAIASRDASVAARTLLNTLPELRAEGLPIDGLREEDLVAVLRAFGAGRFPREAIPLILSHLLSGGGSVDEAIAARGVGKASHEEVEAVVDRLLTERADFVASRGEAALGPLMGVAMEILKGRADGSLVSQVLRTRLEERARAGKT